MLWLSFEFSGSPTTSLVQCLYVGGEESFHLHKISLLARSDQKVIASDMDFFRLSY